MLKRTLDHSQHTAIAVGDALSLFKRSSSFPEPWTKSNDTHAMSPFAFEMKPNPVLFHYITPSTNDCSTIFTADKRYQHIPLDLSRIENESSLGSERSARSKSLLALGTALLEIAYRAVVGFGIGASAHRVCSKTRQGTATQLATIIKPRIIEIDDFANVDVSIATTNNVDEPQPKKLDYEVSQSSTSQLDGERYQTSMLARSDIKVLLPTKRLIDCQYCGFNFSTPGKLNDHIYRKHIRRFECDVCNMKFFLSADLARHKRGAHRSAGDNFGLYFCPNENCRVPGRPFGRLDNFRRHLRTCEE